MTVDIAIAFLITSICLSELRFSGSMSSHELWEVTVVSIDWVPGDELPHGEQWRNVQSIYTLDHLVQQPPQSWEEAFALPVRFW